MSTRLQNISNQITSSESRLIEWRQKYPLDRTHVRYTLYTEKYSKIVDSLFDVIIQNPQIFRHSNLFDLNRRQQRLDGNMMALAMHKLRPVRPQIYSSDMHALSIIAHGIYHFDPGFSVKSDITFFLYAKTLYYFAGENTTQQKLMREAMTYQHIGCFGLTEIGHGSNVKGILTQAIYDHNTKQFIIHSPHESAMKFWIGAAAELATMSVIWAQLIIDGVQYGPHPFIVPIRNSETHAVYPGVTIGDCGAKNGANLIDNGYILFNQYRIPKDYGLNRLSGVDQNGQFFKKTKNLDKLFGMYMGPLSSGRSFIACNSMAAAISCLSIATRYACTRRQFSPSQNSPESLLIDYQSMRHRIMPNLAQCFVYLFGGINLLKMYDTNVKQLLDPQKNKLMEQLHAITGPCKAKSSWFASKVITECRQIMGGHGYSAYSGFSRIYHAQDVNTTWEGDNNMLLQQTTKYILKILNKLNKGKSFQNNTLAFLSETIEIEENASKKDLYDLNYLEKAIKIRIRDLSQECIGLMVEQKAEGKDPMQIWNQAQPYFGNWLSSAYGDLYYMEHIRGVINQLTSEWKQVAINCTLLWAFNLLMEWKWGTLQTRNLLQQCTVELVQWLTPRSVSILDCLSAPSQVIGSVFASENGEGMKEYINKLFTGKKTFEGVSWSQNLIKLREQK